jgi:hypothetical protein
MKLKRKKKKNKFSSYPNDLDLHGIKHPDVDVIVEEHILLHKPPFYIITGHSVIMKKLTKAVLNRHKYKHQEGINLGCIFVTSE